MMIKYFLYERKRKSIFGNTSYQWIIMLNFNKQKVLYNSFFFGCWNVFFEDWFNNNNFYVHMSDYLARFRVSFLIKNNANCVNRL